MRSLPSETSAKSIGGLQVEKNGCLLIYFKGSLLSGFVTINFESRSRASFESSSGSLYFEFRIAYSSAGDGVSGGNVGHPVSISYAKSPKR
jgi:hypothetical protein